MLAEEAKEKRDKEFKSLAQNLHHLMSIQHIRGVYNPIPQYVMVRDHKTSMTRYRKSDEGFTHIVLFVFAHSNRP